jgi:DNA-binding NarL/FixJ family response regulator
MTSDAPAGEVIRIVLADDHTLFREGVASLLERAGDLALIGEAASGEEAARLADDLLPDIVLMDLKMPGIGGIEATRAITGRNPHIGVIVLTMFEDDASVFAALKAGARGYVLKDADRGTLLRAIRAVARGEVLLGPSIARRVLAQFGAAPIAASTAAPGTDNTVQPVAPPQPAGAAPLTLPGDELTPRELEVLRLIAGGLRNREIADRLSISEKTVGNHISNIFAKLRVADRSQAIVRALRSGLVPPG